MSQKHPLRVSSVGFVLKHHHEDAHQLAIDLSKFVVSKGKGLVFASESVVVARKVQGELKRSPGVKKAKISVVPKSRLGSACDLVVVLGGDGTFLSVARLMYQQSVPILGVNMGTLGFLTETKKSEAFDVMGQILSREPMHVQERPFLFVEVKRKGKKIFSGPVVNDAVISKGAIARIIGTHITINGHFASEVRADGIIVSTPTGSTAYALAAGGPIVDPDLDALIIAPICPHSLSQRPMVIPGDAELRISLSRRPGHVFLTLDGQEGVDLKERDEVIVRRLKNCNLKMISNPNRDYFALLREKFRFGLHGK